MLLVCRWGIDIASSANQQGPILTSFRALSWGDVGFGGGRIVLCHYTVKLAYNTVYAEDNITSSFRCRMLLPCIVRRVKYNFLLLTNPHVLNLFLAEALRNNQERSMHCKSILKSFFLWNPKKQSEIKVMVNLWIR